MLNEHESRKSEIKIRLSQLESEKRLLVAELKSLEADDALKEIYGTPAADPAPTTSEARIALFYKLFSCRKDIFPRLWENKAKGTKGYSPACTNEWLPGVCYKPKVKCTNSPAAWDDHFDTRNIRTLQHWP